MNTRPLLVLIGSSLALLLGACASIPTGPSVMALPGTGKLLSQFRVDDAECQSYAFGQVGDGTTPILGESHHPAGFGGTGG